MSKQLLLPFARKSPPPRSKVAELALERRKELKSKLQREQREFKRLERGMKKSEREERLNVINKLFLVCGHGCQNPVLTKREQRDLTKWIKCGMKWNIPLRKMDVLPRSVLNHLES